MTATPDPATHFTVKKPPEYELKLLTAMSFFLGRPIEAQAVACLAMYLRQSEPRVMAQVRYYADQINRRTGQNLTEYDLLEHIVQHPEQVTAWLQDVTGVHDPADPPDVFEPIARTDP